MSEWTLEAPVAFIILNRPQVKGRVFQAIADARPKKLLVVADGPRADREGEVEKCAATREIVKGVDWDCEVLTNYSDVNLGCKQRVSSGLDWVFEMVPEAIILEDDCLPHPNFFRFCDTLLEHYRDDNRVGMISGDNFQFGESRTDASYYFSRYTHIWGWASWRRAWALYDRDMQLWPDSRKSANFHDMFPNSRERRFWKNIFEKTYAGKIDTWDYQWTHALWISNILTILPNVNLVSNIGFGVDATHTFGDGPGANMHTQGMDFPLIHPIDILINAEADRFTFKNLMHQPLHKRILMAISSLINRRFN